MAHYGEGLTFLREGDKPRFVKVFESMQPTNGSVSGSLTISLINYHFFFSKIENKPYFIIIISLYFMLYFFCFV